MKLCKDCKHAKRNWLHGWEYAKCRRHAPEADPVTGKLVRRETYCSNQRAFGNLCGPDAVFFVSKNPPKGELLP